MKEPYFGGYVLNQMQIFEVWKLSTEIQPTSAVTVFWVCQIYIHIYVKDTFTPSIPFRFQSHFLLHQAHFRFSLLLLLDYVLISHFAPLSYCTCSASTILFCILADSILTLLYLSTFYTVLTTIRHKFFHGFEPNFVFSC